MKITPFKISSIEHWITGSLFCDLSKYNVQRDMGLVARKPVFGVFGKVRLKPVSSGTETS